jgi:hypothetical protein
LDSGIAAQQAALFWYASARLSMCGGRIGRDFDLLAARFICYTAFYG